MPVRIEHFGASEVARVERVLDDGRSLVVAGQTFTLRQMTGRYVREGEPYYGTRLHLTVDPCPPGT